MRTLAFLAAVMMMVMVLLPVASAENGWGDDDAYFITITAAEGTYNIGDEVTVTVHVFDAGEYAEVDNVTLMVGSIFTTREVQVEEGATGRWAGTFTIEEDDVLFAYVYLSAEAFIEGISVEDGMGMVYLEETAIMEDPLVITQTVSPPGVYMSIGDTKKVTWKITHKGTPVDPEFIELQLDEDGNSQEVQPSKMSTGVYEYTYTMASTPRSMRVSFELWAEYDTGTETIEGSNDVSLILNHLHVWAKKVAVSATSASFEVYVANLTGSAVEAAAINVNYFYHDEDGDPVSKKSNGTTDTSGRALIDFAYNDLGTEQYEVDMEGKVTAQGKEQTVEFTLAVRAEPGDEPDVPEDDGFDVIAGKDIFDFDKTANLPATAYFDGETMNAAEVYWYAVSPNAVINKGTKTTAVDGTFSVDFRTPKKGDASYKIVTTYFETPVEDGSTMYYGDEETIMVSSVNIDDTPDSFIDAIGMYEDSSISIDVGKIEKGTYVPVTISYSGADETWVCAIMLSNDPSPGNLERVPGWTYWTESPIEGMYGDMAQYDGSKFTGDIFIPETMPNKGFFVSVVFVNMAALEAGDITDFDQWIKTRYADGLEVGKTGSSDDDENGGILDTLMDADKGFLGIPLLYWLVIIIVLVAVGLVAGNLVRRKGAAPKAPAAEAGEPEGPSFRSDLGPAQMPMPAQSYDQMQAVPGQAEIPPPAPAPDYGAPPAPAPEYGAPPAPAPEYGALPVEAPAPEYAAPQAPEVAPQAAPPVYEAPPAPGVPEAPPAYAPPTQPAEAPMAPEAPQSPEVPPSVVPPGAPPVDPAIPPVAAPPVAAPPVAAPPVAAPPVAAAPAAVAPAAAAPAADAGATMTIRCQKCGTTLTIPRKRPIKVTCPNCSASGVLR